MKNKEIARLVKRAKAQEQTAFDELYKHMWPSVYYLAFKQIRNPEDAADLTQEVFLTISRDLRNLRDDIAFNRWTYKITLNLCNQYLRAKRGETVPIDEAEESMLDQNTNSMAEEIELRQAIANIVSDLPDEQRQAILLFYYNDLSTKEIAKILETTPNAVNIKLTRARATIKAKVEELNNGAVLRNLATLPALAHVLSMEAQSLCTAAVGEQIFTGLQAQMLAEASVAGATSSAAGSAAAAGSSVVAKISVGILSIAIIGGAGALGLYLINNHAPEPEPQTPVVAEPGQPQEQEWPLTELEGFVGGQDAAAIEQWGTASTQNNNERLLEIAERHGFMWDNAYIDIDPTGGMYMLFWLEKQDKRLLVCEYYNATNREWAVVYSIEDIENEIPQAQELKEFFATASSREV